MVNLRHESLDQNKTGIADDECENSGDNVPLSQSALASGAADSDPVWPSSTVWASHRHSSMLEF